MNKNYSVILPSAKVVREELQSIGKIPAVVYPVNQRISFDYIYEIYPEEYCSFEIVCFEAVDKVSRGLARYLRKKNVAIRTLDSLGDLGYTVYFGIKDIDDPIIINFADTIVYDIQNKIVDDSVYYSEDYLSNIWTFFDEEEGVITRIYDKQHQDDHSKKKLFTGVFCIADTGFFRQCLEKGFDSGEGIDSFYSALKMYSTAHPLKYIKADNWFDLGHIDNYNNSMLEVKARTFNHISVDRNRGILKKTSENKEKLIGEILWYIKLPSDIEYSRPRIFSYSTDYNMPYISMEYYDYRTIHELFLYGDIEYNQWIDIFSRIRFVLEDYHKYSVRSDKIIPSLEEMYITKTVKRIESLKKDIRFEPYFLNTITVNGKKYLSLQDVVDKLIAVVPLMLYDVEAFNIIHGDLCFSNIMIDSNFSFIKLIDPRGRFGQFDIFGDFRYELAKLFHSVDGKYDYIIKDLVAVSYSPEDRSIKYSYPKSSRNFDVFDIFKKVFEEEIGKDQNKIRLIEALLFFSMIPLHSESIDHQMTFLAVALDILGSVIDIEAQEIKEKENAQ